jgi:hypothetical protein
MRTNEMVTQLAVTDILEKSIQKEIASLALVH